MKFFHVICTLENRKIYLIIQSNSLEEAKKLIHNQGYTIVQIKEEQDVWNVSGLYFYFEFITPDGLKNQGKIQAIDIVSAYRELVDNLGFSVNFIYDNPEVSYEEKIKIISKVRANYDLFHQTTFSQKQKEELIREKDLQTKNSEIPLFLKEEIQKYTNIIQSITSRIEFLMVTYRSVIPLDRIKKIEELIPMLQQVKNSSNANKIRYIGQKALLKIGEIEKELITQKIVNEKQFTFQETNKLLQSLWSKERVVLEQEDITRRLTFVFRFFFSFFRKFFNSEKDWNIIIKNSSTHLQILRELSLYRKKKREILKEIIFTIITFNSTKRRRLQIKYLLIKQNIALISHRIKGGVFSFTMIAQGFDYYKDILVYTVRQAGYFFLWILFVLIVFFLFIISFSTQKNLLINPVFLAPFTFISCFTLSSRFTRSFLDLVFLSGILGVYIIFLSLNF